MSHGWLHILLTAVCGLWTGNRSGASKALRALRCADAPRHGRGACAGPAAGARSSTRRAGAGGIISLALALLLTLTGLSPAASTGDQIVNRATLSTQEQPPVTASVAVTYLNRSISTISFFKYAPEVTGASAVPVGVTSYLNASGWHPLAAPVMAGTQTPINLSQGPLPLLPVATFHAGEPVFIQLRDADQNLDATRAETVTVTIVDPKTGDSETLTLTETGPNTGIFTGYIQTSSGTAVSGDGVLTVSESSSMTAQYTDPADPSDSSSITAVVDPFGIVFDSSTGKPIDGVTIELLKDDGSPATVLGDDGVATNRFPNRVTSGGTATDTEGRIYAFSPGGYRFPFVAPGRYILRVTPPVGFSSPSTVTPDDIAKLTTGPFTILSDGSYGNVFSVPLGPAIRIDVPIDPRKGTLWLTKTASKGSVAPGEYLGYDVTLDNTDASTPVNSAVIVDILPPGFRYQKGTTRLNGVASADPEISPDGSTLRFPVGTVAPKTQLLLHYVVAVGAGAKPGNAINTVTANATVPAGTPATVNQATATVNVQEPFLQSRSIIMGRVVVGACSDKEEDNKKGMAGIGIYLEDGTFVLTDPRGMYHLEGVPAGVHVVQLDLDSIPEGYRIVSCEQNSRFAGRAYSQFVDIQGGTMWRADFHLERLATEPEPAKTAIPAAPVTPAPHATPTAPLTPSAPSSPAGPAGPTAPTAPAAPGAPLALGAPNAEEITLKRLGRGTAVTGVAPAAPAAPAATAAPGAPSALVAPSAEELTLQRLERGAGVTGAAAAPGAEGTAAGGSAGFTGEIALEMISSEEGGVISYRLPMHAETIPLKNLRLTVNLPPGVVYRTGSSTLDGVGFPDPEIAGTNLSYPLGQTGMDWHKEIRFKASVAPATQAGELQTTARLTFDSPSANAVAAPEVDNILSLYREEGRVSLSNVVLHPHFPTFGSELSSEDRRQLDELALVLRRFRIDRIQVTGHTDSVRIAPRSRGVYPDNGALSFARAKSVGRYLTAALHLPPESLNLTGRGEREPVASNRNEEGRAENRRVEVKVALSQDVVSSRVTIIKDRSGLKKQETSGNEESLPTPPQHYAALASGTMSDTQGATEAAPAAGLAAARVTAQAADAIVAIPAAIPSAIPAATLASTPAPAAPAVAAAATPPAGGQPLSAVKTAAAAPTARAEAAPVQMAAASPLASPTVSPASAPAAVAAPSAAAKTAAPAVQKQEGVELYSALGDGILHYRIKLAGVKGALKRVKVTLVTPKSHLYLTGSSRLSGSATADPETRESSISYDIAKLPDEKKFDLRLQALLDGDDQAEAQVSSVTVVLADADGKPLKTYTAQAQLSDSMEEIERLDLPPAPAVSSPAADLKASREEQERLNEYIEKVPQKQGATQNAAATADTGSHVRESEGIHHPVDGSLIASQINAVRIVLSSSLTPVLTLDGKVIPAERQGFKMKDPETEKSLYTYIGVDFGAPGEHVLKLAGKDPFGVARFEGSAKITRTGEIATIRVLSTEGNVADGKTPVRVRVQLLDKENKPVAANAELQLKAGDLRPVSESGNLGRDAGTGMVAVDGEGWIKFQPVTNSGLYRAVLSYNKASVEIETYVKPKMRNFILVGLAEGTAGYNVASGHVENLKAAGEDDKFYDNERLAFYAKGTIKGEWLLTMSYDSAKKETGVGGNSLFRNIDPNSFYTVYGDGSVQGYDASSQKKLYVKVERDQFYAMFGDFDTGLTVTELSRYSRRMNGIKSEFRSQKFEATVFGSETGQAFAKDEIRGDGTSGLYRLSRKGIVINSETVTIESRDRFHSERVTDSRPMARFVDYSIDYEAGTIFFKGPVASRDEQLNPVYIVVDYEVADAGADAITAGGRVGTRLMDGNLKLGGSYIHEGYVTGGSNLYGADAALKLGGGTTARAEIATSNTDRANQKASGSAYLAEVIHTSPTLDAKGYFREQQSGFGLGQQAGSETGTRKFGAEAAYKITPSFALSSQAYREENLSGGNVRDFAEALGSYSDKERSLSTRAGVRWANDSLADGTRAESLLGTVGASWKTLNQRLTLRADHDQALSKNNNVDYPTRTILGADFQATKSVALFAQEELTHGTTGNTNTTRVGVKATPWSGGTLSSSLGNDIRENGERTFATVGLAQKWQVTPHWTLDGGVDHSRTLRSKTNYVFDANIPPASGSTTSEDFTAVSVGANYQVKKLVWSNRVEYRTSTTENKWGLITGVMNEQGLYWGWSGKLQVLNSRAVGGNDSTDIDLRLGLAYRPPVTKWILLDRLDLISNDASSSTSSTRGKRIINNLNANYRPGNRFQLSLQYGAKYVLEQIDGNDYSGYTDLFGAEARYDLNRSWDIGLRASLLHTWALGQVKYSLAPTVGYNLMQNGWLSLGYNVFGFTDRDFSAANYTAQGPFVQFRFKFDQHSVKEGLKALNW